MRSKWYRGVAMAALVAAFAAGTVAVSGGYQPFQIGGDPLRGVTQVHVSDSGPSLVAGSPKGLGRLAGFLFLRWVGPLRPDGASLASFDLIGESIFD